MDQEAKIDLLLEMVADIYVVAQRLAVGIPGLTLIPPAALKIFLAGLTRKGG